MVAPKFNFGDILYTWHFDNQVWIDLGFRIYEVRVIGIQYLKPHWILYEWEFVNCYPAVAKSVKVETNYKSNETSLYKTRDECISGILKYLDEKKVKVIGQNWDLKL